MNLVPCLTWIKTGVAKAVPDQLQLNQEELKRLIEEAKSDYKDSLIDEVELDLCGNEEDEVDIENKEADSLEIADDDEKDVDSRYNLDDYDNDESETNPIFSIAGLTLYADSKDDPNITVPDEEDDEEEKENFQVKSSDNLLVVGHVESDSSVLEVYVYNEEEGDLYVHHDIVLPAYPLAIEWLDFHPSDDNPGNYVAVSDMTPVINIWDLDVVDILEPYYKLGEKKKKREKKAKKTCEMSCGHTDAVLDLSWNRHVRNILSSGSADKSICLWDLQETKCVSQLNFHTDKVQSLKWSPSETHILMSGGCDGLINLYDCRKPDVVGKHWSVEGEVERVLWNHFDSNFAFCSTDQGFVHCIDTRVDKMAYVINAHNEAVTGMDLSTLYPGCLITASTDRTYKVWDVSSEPKFIVAKKMKLGSLYVAKANPDHPFTFAFGGDNRSLNLKVLNLMDISECSEHFNKDMTSVGKKAQEPTAEASNFCFPATGTETIKNEDNSMETDINEFQGLSLSGPVSSEWQKTSSAEGKKSKRKNKFKNKKKFM